MILGCLRVARIGPFEIYTALEAPVCMRKFDVLNAFQTFGKQAVCDFFKEFVKRGSDDARYYELIYTMLTHRLNGNFPLGFQ